MARYDKAHKDATKRRIVDRAGRRLKRHGIERSGIAALMADAGLTNGAFYAHFASKDDLVATVVSDQLEVQRERYRAAALNGRGFEGYLRDYLSAQHRDHPEEGCPSAALLEEIGRGPEATRRAYTDGVVAFVDDIVASIGADDPRDARLAVMSIVASMVGTVQLSRAIADEALADELLARGIENALALLGWCFGRVKDESE